MIQCAIVRPARHRHAHDGEVHGGDAPLEAREQHDAGPVPSQLPGGAGVRIQPDDAPVAHHGRSVERVVIGVVHGDLDPRRPGAAVS